LKINIITIENNHKFDLKGKIKNYCCCCCCCCCFYCYHNHNYY
jgi:hypothetical protein